MNSVVFNEDCMSVMSRYESKHFDLVVADPPYGINASSMQMGSNPNRSRNDGHGSGPGVSVAVRLRGRLNSGGEKLKNRILNTSDIAWDAEIPPPEYFDEVERVSGHQIIWGGNYFGLPATRCVVCWDKNQPWENFSQWEMAWTSYDKPSPLFRFSNRGGANMEVKIHPTQKPVELYYWLFKKFLPDGGRVLDTHLGSGSSRIAAHQCGNIDFTGCEINADYFANEQKRFAVHSSQTTLDL